MMNDIMAYIQEYREWFYLITFIWTVLEGETFVIFAGLAAQKGLLDIRLLFFCAALGSMVGDQICFFLGHRYGRRIIHHFPKIEPKMDRVIDLLEKYSVSFILSYRFMYGIRNVSALTIGMSHLTWKRFLFLNTIASIIWAASFCAVGYFMGDLVDRFGIAEGDIQNVMIACLFLFILIISLRIYFGQRNSTETADPSVVVDSSKDEQISEKEPPKDRSA